MASEPQVYGMLHLYEADRESSEAALAAHYKDAQRYALEENGVTIGKMVRVETEKHGQRMLGWLAAGWVNDGER